MSNVLHDPEAICRRIIEQVESAAVRVTLHAQQEMVEEDIQYDDVLGALTRCQLLENYPEHRRGACCLVYGDTALGRPLHVVCTTAMPVLILITVYEPKPPKWVTPTQRRSSP